MRRRKPSVGNDAIQALLDEAARRNIAKPATAPWVPVSLTPKQAEYVDHPGRFVLFGGALGSGKSIAALASAAKYVEQPGYSALILRQTYPELLGAGGLLSEAHAWWSQTGATFSHDEMSYRFPAATGRRPTIQFGHMSDSTAWGRYRGKEYHDVELDEADAFKREQWLQLTQRLRRKAGDPIPLRGRATANPWVPGRQLWVYEDFVNPESRQPDHHAVLTTMGDNPHLDVESYRASLAHLPDAMQRALIEGVWEIDASGLLYPVRTRHLVSELPEMARPQYVLGVDLGASVLQPTTAFCVVAYDLDVPRNIVVVEARESTELHDDQMAAVVEAYMDRYKGLRVRVDHGALGARVVRLLSRDKGLPVGEADKRNKVYHQQLLRGAIERNELAIVQPHCEPLVRDLTKLRALPDGTEDPSCPHHLSDALLYAWRGAMTVAHWTKAPAPPKSRIEERFAADYRRRVRPATPRRAWE